MIDKPIRKRGIKINKEKTIKKILKEHLVSPILRLKETHPQYSFTEKGYEILIDTTYQELLKIIK